MKKNFLLFFLILSCKSEFPNNLQYPKIQSINAEKTICSFREHCNVITLKTFFIEILQCFGKHASLVLFVIVKIIIWFYTTIWSKNFTIGCFQTSNVLCEFCNTWSISAINCLATVGTDFRACWKLIITVAN